MATLLTGDLRPIFLQLYMGIHSPCPTAAQATLLAPTPTLVATRILSPLYCPTLRLVPWLQLHQWPICWHLLGPHDRCSSRHTASRTPLASCIRSLWASTHGFCPPPPCTHRDSSSPSFPRTHSLPHPPTPVFLSAPPK